MGLLARIFGIETRGVIPTDPYWANFMAMRGGVGPFLSPDIVLSNLAVAARCIALRSEMLASVPLFLFRRTPDGGRERADDNPLYDVLHDQPNPLMSGFEFREQLIRSLDLDGNHYSRIERNARGQVTAIWPYRPGEMQVEKLPNGRLRYRVYDGRSNVILLQEEVLHVRAASRDGLLGLSPIAVARSALGLAVSQAHTATSMSHNGLRPSGILTYPMPLNELQKQTIRDGMQGFYGGTDNAGRVVVADGGAKYETVSFSPEDSQFLEQRKLANEDIARIFNVPPTACGILDKATYSNVEQEASMLVQNCIGPLASRIEAACHRCLLTDAGRRSLYVEHDLDGLLRGDVKSRFDAYRVARESGIYSVNDIRRRENEPPIGPEGDIYNMPANWVQLGGA